MHVSRDGELTTFQDNLFHIGAALIRGHFPELAFLLGPRGEWPEEEGAAHGRGRGPRYPWSSDCICERWEQVRRPPVPETVAGSPCAAQLRPQGGWGGGSECPAQGPAGAGPAHQEVRRDYESNWAEESWAGQVVCVVSMASTLLPAQPGLGKTSWARGSSPCDRRPGTKAGLLRCPWQPTGPAGPDVGLDQARPGRAARPKPVLGAPRNEQGLGAAGCGLAEGQGGRGRLLAQLCSALHSGPAVPWPSPWEMGGSKRFLVRGTGFLLPSRVS